MGRDGYWGEVPNGRARQAAKQVLKTPGRAAKPGGRTVGLVSNSTSNLSPSLPLRDGKGSSQVPDGCSCPAHTARGEVHTRHGQGRRKGDSN